jgi:hypothetical protein
MDLRTLSLTAAVLALAAAARSETRVQVVETDPAGPATLDNWQHFSLRINYRSDQPIRVRCEPYFEGQRVPSMNGGSPLYDAGDGNAFFWFSYTDARRVDSVVVTGETSSGKVVAKTSIPVDLTWSGQASSTPQVKAGWVQSMEAERARQMQAATDAYYNSAQGLLLGALGSLIIAAVPAYFVLQVVTLRRLRGGWRRAAAIPLVPMAAVLVYTVFAFAAGSNLFPLVLIFTSVPGAIYLFVILFLGSRVTSSATPSPGPSL